MNVNNLHFFVCVHQYRPSDRHHNKGSGTEKSCIDSNQSINQYTNKSVLRKLYKSRAVGCLYIDQSNQNHPNTSQIFINGIKPRGFIILYLTS